MNRNSSSEHLMFYVNASKTPNAEFMQERGQVYVRLTRDVERGEELFVPISQYSPIESDPIMLAAVKENVRFKSVKKFSRDLKQHLDEKAAKIKERICVEMQALVHIVEHSPTISIYANVAAALMRAVGFSVPESISSRSVAYRYIVHDDNEKWVGVQDMATGNAKFLFALFGPTYTMTTRDEEIECDYLVPTRYEKLGRFGYGNKSWRSIDADPKLCHIEGKLIPAQEAWEMRSSIHYEPGKTMTVRKITKKYRLRAKKRKRDDASSSDTPIHKQGRHTE